jgi:hypothetical protein
MKLTMPFSTMCLAPPRSVRAGTPMFTLPGAKHLAIKLVKSGRCEVAAVYRGGKGAPLFLAEKG